MRLSYLAASCALCCRATFPPSANPDELQSIFWTGQFVGLFSLWPCPFHFIICVLNISPYKQLFPIEIAYSFKKMLALFYKWFQKCYYGAMFVKPRFPCALDPPASMYPCTCSPTVQGLTTCLVFVPNTKAVLHHAQKEKSYKKEIYKITYNIKNWLNRHTRLRTQMIKYKWKYLTKKEQYFILFDISSEYCY